MECWGFLTFSAPLATSYGYLFLLSKVSPWVGLEVLFPRLPACLLDWFLFVVSWFRLLPFCFWGLCSPFFYLWVPGLSHRHVGC